MGFTAMPLGAVLLCAVLMHAGAETQPSLRADRALHLRGPTGELSWVRGVNYVPSYSRNDIWTWAEFNSTLIAHELQLASRADFNAVRIFLGSFVWQARPTEFLADLETFVALAHSRGMQTLPVLFDSCCAATQPNASWVLDGTYRHTSWVPSPGPDRLGPSDWPASEAFLTAVVTRYRGDQRILGWEVMNEPLDSGSPTQIVAFLEHMISFVNRLDPAHFTTVGGQFAAQPSQVLGATALSLHDYNGARGSQQGGHPNAKHIAQVKQLARQLNISGVLISETGGRPSQPYCAAVQDAVSQGTGYFLWALMIGADQFGPPLSPGSPPFQGLVYPNGTWFDELEELPCIRSPSSVVLASDTDTEMVSYAPTGAWSLWTKPGTTQETCVRTWGPRFCTLHFAKDSGASATFALPSLKVARSVLVYYKRGSDCGFFDVYVVNSAGNSTLAATVDAYAPALGQMATAEWNARVNIPIGTMANTPDGVQAPEAPLAVRVVARGQANPKSTSTLVQLVGFSVVSS